MDGVGIAVFGLNFELGIPNPALMMNLFVVLVVDIMKNENQQNI